jgi:4-hydroxy-tetrahydrodipicolinate synthase
MSSVTTFKKGFHGVWPDVPTPLKADLGIDFSRLETHIRTLLVKGAQGVVLFSHSGEGASFSYAEKLAAIKYLLESGIEAGSLILSATANAATDSQRIIHLVEGLGLHGFLLSAPYYYKSVSTQGLIDYFDFVCTFIEKKSTKMYLHVLSSATHLDIPEAVVSALIERHSDNLYGIVNQSGSSSYTSDLIKSFASVVMIYSSNEADFKTLKPPGTISLMANLMPKIVGSMIFDTKSKVGGTFIPGMKEAVGPEQRASALEALIGSMPSIAAYKYLLSLTYHDHEWSRVRPPLITLDQKAKEGLDKSFKAFNLRTSEE